MPGITHEDEQRTAQSPAGQSSHEWETLIIEARSPSSEQLTATLNARWQLFSHVILPDGTERLYFKRRVG